MDDSNGTGENVSVMKAAEVLGTTHLRILMLVKQGDLKGGQDGGGWFVNRESLEGFRKHGGALRAASSCRSSCGAGGCGGHNDGRRH